MKKMQRRRLQRTSPMRRNPSALYHSLRRCYCFSLSYLALESDSVCSSWLYTLCCTLSEVAYGVKESRLIARKLRLRPRRSPRYSQAFIFYSSMPLELHRESLLLVSLRWGSPLRIRTRKAYSIASLCLSSGPAFQQLSSFSWFQDSK